MNEQSERKEYKMSLKDKIPNLPNLSKIGANKIKVYAFVGPSGQGKAIEHKW